MPNLNPLKFCIYCRKAKPRAAFRPLPGAGRKREMCAECYEKAQTRRKVAKNA